MSSSDNVNPEHSEDARKMYVDGFAPETTSEELAAYFGSFGEIETHIIIKKERKDPHNQQNQQPAKVFGFITFCDADFISECLINRPHTLNGNELNIKHAVPKGNTLLNFMVKTKKLYISKLAPNTSSEQLEKFLKSKFPKTEYGTFEKVNVVMKKDEEGKPTEECKGFGFAEVSSEDFADKVALLMHQFDFNGRKCALVKSSKDGMNKGGHAPGGYGAGYGGYDYYGYGGNYGGWGGYGGQYAGQWGSGYGQADYGQSQGGYGNQRYRPYYRPSAQ